jgi:hypothetical protein
MLRYYSITACNLFITYTLIRGRGLEVDINALITVVVLQKCYILLHDMREKYI